MVIRVDRAVTREPGGVGQSAATTSISNTSEGTKATRLAAMRRMLVKEAKVIDRLVAAWSAEGSPRR
jgi:hypothetical protein